MEKRVTSLCNEIGLDVRAMTSVPCRFDTYFNMSRRSLQGRDEGVISVRLSARIHKDGDIFSRNWIPAFADFLKGYFILHNLLTQ